MGVGIQVIEGNQELTTYITIEAELAHLFLKVSFERKNAAHMRKNSKRVIKKLLPEIMFRLSRHTIFSNMNSLKRN